MESVELTVGADSHPITISEVKLFASQLEYSPFCTTNNEVSKIYS